MPNKHQPFSKRRYPQDTLLSYFFGTIQFSMFALGLNGPDRFDFAHHPFDLGVEK